MRRIYLDYNATAPLDPVVLESMLPFWEGAFGNPSSLHWAGAEARKILSEARDRIAACLKCEDGEIVFTSGGTESNNLALQGVVAQAVSSGRAKPHIVTTQIEHSSVLETVRYLEKKGLIDATYLGVDARGDLDMEEVKASLKPETALISLMFANNEIGNIYPINAIGNLAREQKIIFHTDAVQAVGKLPVDLSRLPVDLLSFSAHKIGGPKGIGGLFARKGIKLEKVIHGGAQEFEKRGGTENVAAAVGMAQALEIAMEEMPREMERQARLRDRFQAELARRVTHVRFHGNDLYRIANTLNVGFEGITSESILIALDREGIAASSGSACASGAVEPSHVLMAMGIPRSEAKGAVRFSLGRGISDEDIDYVLETLPRVVQNLRLNSKSLSVF